MGDHSLNAKEVGAEGGSGEESRERTVEFPKSDHPQGEEKKGVED